MLKKLRLLSVLTASFIATNLASAQDPVTQRPGQTTPTSIQAPAATNQAAPTIVNTSMVLTGSETLPGYGKLTFTVLNGGRVFMVDSNNKPVEGKARVEGNRAIFTFTDCIYEGTSQGNNAFTGRAWYTAGSRVGETWEFRVVVRPTAK